MIDFEVDLVVPFVNNREKVWLRTHNEYCNKNRNIKCTNSSDVRYDDIGFKKSLCI